MPARAAGASSSWLAGALVELAVIALVIVVFRAITPRLPTSIELSYLVLAAAALLLAQGLVRDLVILARHARQRSTSASRCARLMCVESVLGASLVVVGVLLVLAGIGGRIGLSAAEWTVGAAGVLLLGLLLKDLVIDLARPAIRIERDHLNVVFRWRS